MHFSDPQFIKDFLIKAIGEENLGDYKIWHDWGSFCIRTDNFVITCGFSGDQSLFITFLTVRKGLVFSTLSGDSLLFCHPDMLEPTINGWFFRAMETFLEDVFL